MNRYVGAQERNTQIPDWNQGRAKACGVMPRACAN
jgi:hypothetical protein